MNLATRTMNWESKIYVAGHNGMVGSALMRELEWMGYKNVCTRSHERLDLLDESAVSDFLIEERPEYIFLAAARVGGILANDRQPWDFLYQNLQIAANVISAARLMGVKKLLFLGSSCIYPRTAPQPIQEEALLTGALEPTNEWYAIAKIAGIKLCQAARKQYGCDFISAMPCNLYGPNDHYDPETSHVIPGLIRKFHDAKIANAPYVTLWGDGTPLREFLHVEDLASACLWLMEHYSGAAPANVGSGDEISIGDLARLIAGVVGYKGEIRWDRSKPSGTPRKLLDSSRLRESSGWKPFYRLHDGGLRRTYEEFLKQR